MVSGTKSHVVGDHRRRRLTQILNHEGEKVSSPSGPTARGSRSLPVLPSLNSTKSATFTDFDLDVALVPTSEQGPLLSPLKHTRRGGGTSADKSFVSPEQPTSSIEALHTNAVVPNTEVSRKILPAGTHGTHPATQDVLIPMNNKGRQQSRERTKSDVILLHQRREAAREQYARTIQLFDAQREALLEFCLQQFRGQVDGDELKTINMDLEKMMAKAYRDLQLRLSKLQDEELRTAQKKQALQCLKKSHQDQIERHLSTAKEQRKQELAAREYIVKEQERLDRNYEAHQAERKLHTKSHDEKLAEQIKNNAVARSAFKLTVQGSSPLYRTPWWSDESDERLGGFQRPMTVQAPMQSPVIHSKQRCQWYD
ncbi:hypothetical protein PF003_g38791 [Phytophthora fragariae]|nr:hypothetical protein PF003_g38791 [Phytophthora fragariae]